MFYAGIDWADQKHDVLALDEAGRKLGWLQVAHTPEGFSQLNTFLQQITGPEQKEQMACIVETTHGLLIAYVLEAGTDMIVAQPLPLTDLFYDGLSQWEKCAAMAQKYPDRAIFWGSVNPLDGKKALDLMERQVKEYGAKAFKFYNVRYDYGEPFPWRMDDPCVAYPVFEKALELGIHTIGVHKGVPLGPQPIEHTQTWDMDGAAANFPDINFVIFHVGLPYIDEVCWQLVRYPNLYASIAATLNFIVRAPRVFAENMGKLMFWCGEDKILYGGETPIWHPRWALDAFWNSELPEDLVTGYGYPQLTTQAKKKILGGNLARLMGIDVEQKVAELRR